MNEPRQPEDMRPPWLMVAAITLLAAVGSIEGVLLLRSLPRHSLGDLEIYLGSIEFARQGGSLYDFAYDHPEAPGFGFTYPPFAAVVLAPLAWLPLEVAKRVWTAALLLLSVALAWFVVVPALRRPGMSLTRARTTATALSAAVLLLSQPVLQGLAVGEISLWITALAYWGAVGAQKRPWAASLIGVAAAIKLTPLVFLPYFAVTRQWKALSSALLAFVGALLVGLLSFPDDSVRYWTEVILATQRVGELGSYRNQAVLGSLTRWGVGGDQRTLVWLAVCALLAGVGLWRAARHARHREPAPAALVIGCLSLALSPISWPHHQAWVVLAALWIAIVGPWGFRLLGMLIIASYALGSPLWDQPQDSGLAWRVAGEIPTAIIVALTIFGLPRSRRP